MSRLWLVFLGPIAIGVLILASGVGHLGMCADEGGSIAALLVLFGVTAETVLLLVAIPRTAARKFPRASRNG